MLKLFRDTSLKVVYIGPLKALVRERLKDWTHRFGTLLNKNVLELTGMKAEGEDIGEGD